MIQIAFPDRMVSYRTFIDDLSRRVVEALRESESRPEYVSQREASRLYGRRNVERWRRNGQIEVFKRPGKVEMRTADLVRLKETEQDYYDMYADITYRARRRGQ